MATLQLGDIEIYYEEHGDPSADPVLLIMGFTQSAAAWAPQIPALAERFRVIAFDNRGAGRTTQPEGPYSIPQMAGDTVALLDALGIAATHVVAASMGGMIAQELAIRRPERVRRLVLACTTAGGPHSAGWREMLAKTEEGLAIDDAAAMVTPERVGEMALELFTPEFLASPGPGFAQLVGAAMQYPQTLAGMKGQVHAIRAHDTYDRLGELRAPTLVIAGDADPLIDPANSRILAERIPNARLCLLPGLRHGFTAERPDEVNRIILEFLEERAEAAA